MENKFQIPPAKPSFWNFTFWILDVSHFSNIFSSRHLQDWKKLSQQSGQGAGGGSIHWRPGLWWKLNSTFSQLCEGVSWRNTRNSPPLKLTLDFKLSRGDSSVTSCSLNSESRIHFHYHHHCINIMGTRNTICWWYVMNLNSEWFTLWWVQALL